ncbi:iron-containing alcohol dehydrogenase [Velocimicrobium porci]|uniref:Iron-containing alcohol dehydrogenase n=1 Tax=Velocimicrobium porci TaxID=2606634 RepID=A0A6L5XVJ4_9FIRM|nr:iron-containing alcohol dehydrogenase [Velocimicrobium porci]MSS62381.1 iron-containing alcohol dehydrogenase [Velocimicrobium porci]
MDFKLEQKVKVSVTHELSTTILEILKEKEYKKPMIATGTFQLEMPMVKALLKTLEENKIEVCIYDKVVSDPSTDLVNTGASLFVENGCDSIIGIGGGSAIDTARGINIVRTLGGKIEDYVIEKEVPIFCDGLIAVPTTSGTGSELSNAAVVTDIHTHEKLAVLSDNAVSEYAVLCPELTVTMPKGLTISTGLDAFAHAMEGYTSNLSSPITDAICEKVMYLIVKYLPNAVKNGEDLEARERMMVAAALAGWMLNNAGTHVGHSLAHVIGPEYKIPHGAACAYALPGTMLYTASVKAKKIKEIGYILGAKFPENATDSEIGKITSEKFKWFRDEVLGMESFSKLNITKEELLSNAKKVSEERFAGNSPMPITEELAEKLLKEIG